MAEDGWASLVASFVLQVLKNRVESPLWHAHLLPGMFAGLLQPDMQARRLVDLQHLALGWAGAQEHGASA
eukprot:5595036-Alexandrium_andersonii.AAC.1